MAEDDWIDVLAELGKTERAEQLLAELRKLSPAELAFVVTTLLDPPTTGPKEGEGA